MSYMLNAAAACWREVLAEVFRDLGLGPPSRESNSRHHGNYDAGIPFYRVSVSHIAASRIQRVDC